MRIIFILMFKLKTVNGMLKVILFIPVCVVNRADLRKFGALGRINICAPSI